MARFKIISKDGGTIRYEGKPKYVGTYLRPSYLEFSEIASSVPIAWEVGDYVEYSRTGMTYRLYSIPQATKNARKGSHGRAFTYSGVQLFAATKELDIALFRDLVSNDNNIHFSTSPDVVTFEDVYGIARRIQECMDDLYPGRWEIRVADFDESEDAEIISKISEAKDFALSGGTCLDALSKIYELWQDVGWIHSHENGKEVITIGYTSKRIDANTSESYLYGKGNGLTAIKKTQINRDEFATRLYVYGSERNLPSRYYNTKGILNADSVDIRNLMLPLDKWGMTDNLPDARKAYLENAEAVARFGVIPKTHYFDSEDAGADIYPSISGMTIGMLRKVLDDMGQTKYYPSEANYPDPSQRIDEVRFCDNPEDDGAINIEPIRHSEQEFAEMSEGVVSSTQFIVDNKFLFSEEFTLEEGKACEMVVSPHISGYVEDRGYSLVVVSLRLQDGRYTSSVGHSAVQKVYAKKDGDRWTFDLPEVRFNYAQSPISGFGCKVYITIEGNGASNENSAYVLNAGTVDFSLYPIQSETFVIRLNELGFNIDEMAKVGNGKTISMKTGACAGRSFKIEKSRHMSSYSYWDITCRRQKDSTLGQIFPNSSYQIQAGDKFVLVDIGMPESYIRVAMERLLSEGEKLLSRASKIQNHYEPSIDAKVMMESGRTLREGMFMEITDEDVVDNTTDYILIDSLSIVEDESSIPTYKVTLKERRKVTYKGTPSATSTTDTQTSVGGSENEEGFATETFVTEQINILKGLWHIDESTGNLVTDHQVHIKKSLLIDGDVASGGEGENTTAEGTVTRIDVDGIPYNPDSLGVIDLTEAFKNVKVDLSNYYTKYEVNELIDEIKAGDIDLANYYTKEEIDRKDFLTSASLVGYAKTTDVANTYATKAALATLQSSHNTLRSEFDALNDALNDDVSGKINTWNEIKDFLDEYSGSEDLATIISKINADIAKRAFQSDLTALATRVDTAEGNITSLTNGKADRATTLAGYGITNAYTKGETDSLLGKYVLLEKASQTIKGDITIEGNLVITGDVASGGEGGNTSAEGTVTGVTVSGVDYTSVEAGLLDLTDLMANYALKSASTKVSVSPSLSSGKSIGVISVDGVGTTLYAPATYAWSEISEKPNVLLFGGTSSQFLKADGSVDSNAYVLAKASGAMDANTIYDASMLSLGGGSNLPSSSGYGSLLTMPYRKATGNTKPDYAAQIYIPNGDDTKPYLYYRTSLGNSWNAWRTVLDDGNYATKIGDYYFKSSGGTIEGGVHIKTFTTNPLRITSSGGVQSGAAWFINDTPKSWFGYDNGTHMYDYTHAATLGIATDGVPKFNNYTLLHSGNYSSYALKKGAETYRLNIETPLTSNDADIYAYFQRISVDGTNISASDIGSARKGVLRLAGGGSESQLLFDHYNGALYYRNYQTSSWSAWKTIAFTDSNVAGAYKLVTSAGADAVTIGTNGIELHSGFVGYKDGDAYRYLGPQGSQKKLRFYDSTEWKDIAFTDSDITGNAATATKLQTPRTIWGQSFDGTGNMSGLPIFDASGKHQSSIVIAASAIKIGTPNNAYTGYHNGIAFTALNYGLYSDHIHGWIGLGRYTTINEAECYPLIFATNGSTVTNTAPAERMRITPSGNVGVGTTDPAYKLEVAGTGRFTDSLLVSGTLTANSGATITGDVTINGNLIVSGDVASGGTGQDTPSDETTTTTTTAEWYNIKTRREPSPPGGSLSVNFYNVIENYNEVLNDSSKYRMVIMRFKRGSYGSKHWAIPMFSSRWNRDTGEVVNEGTWSWVDFENTWWSISSRIVNWFANTGATLQTSGFSIDTKLDNKNKMKFSNSNNKKMRMGVAIYKKMDDGLWQRVSNIAEVMLFVNNYGDIYTRVIE